MKFAFLISAHTDALQLRRLINALPENAAFFVHIDSKSDISTFQEHLSGDARIHILKKRINVTWGSFRQVEYQMALLEAVEESKERFDYIISLSGLDFPIWSNERIVDFFQNANNKLFIQGINVAKQNPRSDISHLYRQHRYLASMPWKYGSIGSKFRVALREIAWHIGISKGLTFNANGINYDLYKGSSWWAITMDVAERVLDYWKNNKQYVDYFRDSFGPDETFIQTIVFNDPTMRHRAILTEGEFIDLEQLTPLTYIHYKPEIKILTEEDYPILLQSGKMFCRKVVSGVSDELVTLLKP